MPKQDIYSQIAAELEEWVEASAEWLADAFKGQGGLSPFEAPLTDAQRLAYYEAQFFLPNGLPNVKGRQEEIDRLGPQQYAAALREVMAARGKGVVPALGAMQRRALPSGSEAPPVEAAAEVY